MDTEICTSCGGTGESFEDRGIDKPSFELARCGACNGLGHHVPGDWRLSSKRASEALKRAIEIIESETIKKP